MLARKRPMKLSLEGLEPNVWFATERMNNLDVAQFSKSVGGNQFSVKFQIICKKNKKLPFQKQGKDFTS